MPLINLDTHILIHALAGQISRKERALLGESSWGISAIVLWEIAKLVQLGRIEMDLDSPRLRDVFVGLHVWPIDLDVAVASTRLDFAGDPADELIAATSVVHNVPLLTRDKAIRHSKMVPLVLSS